MKLLVITQYFWPENFRINDLVAEFVRRGHEVTVLTGIPNYPEGKIFQEFNSNPAFYSNYEGADIIRVPMLARGSGSFRLLLNYITFAFGASIWGPWKLRERQFDLIFTCQLSPVTVGFPAAILRKIKRAPMIFWILDLWPQTLHALDIIRSPVLLKIIGKMVVFIYRHCDLILVQSKSFIPQVEKYTEKNKPIKYFPSWAESVFSNPNFLFADEVFSKNSYFNVIFAGNIGEAQDFPSILKAVEYLKNNAQIRWLIIGDGRMAAWVKDEINRLSLHKNILMLGRFPVDRMPSFFRHADALLVTLRNEPIFSMTIPGKLQSYLAAGIPVIAMLNGEGAELVKNSYSGLTCAAGDSVGLANAVLDLSRMDPQDRLTLGQNGLNTSLRDFDRHTLMNQLEEWFKLIVVK